ncbi:hypothetical protein [Yinghuangia soli]|uniref:Uncharacterized protein n=1 Tax=Yinghuangia soli TaxID=2908204 RepID=A0AA41TZB4_9ACTN|nr:hypothetical protein [Yinghuangia soli]MCF2527326.1 hypothetical protein [Yinghuangia soli]
MVQRIRIPWSVAVLMRRDSHLPMLDLIEQLASDYDALDATDARSARL